MQIDELRIYRGDDYQITDKIIIHQPTLGEICDYGEQKFFTMINYLTYVGADLKWQLHEVGIDYTKISDFELFYNFISPLFGVNDTRIILGDINLPEFKVLQNKNTNEIVMYDYWNDIIIDRFVYQMIVSVLRKTYGLKRNDELPGNEAARLVLIEDAKTEYEKNKNKPYESQLLNLISAMVNSSGFKHDEVSVFNMKIGAFMDSVKRISKITNANLLLLGGYAGCIDLKSVDKKNLDWLGEL